MTLTAAQARRLQAPAPRLAALAAVAGFVDAVGFLTLYRLFVAHMSGNTVNVGVWLGQGQWHQALHHLFPIPLFLAGIVVGRLLGLRPTLALEAALLAAFMLSLPHAGPTMSYAIAALPVLAMGLQNATLRHVAGTTVHTTYVTGVLNSIADSAVDYGLWLKRRATRPGRLPRLLRLTPRQPSFLVFRDTLTIWTCYLAAAIAGSLALTHLGSYALLAPIATTLILARHR